MFCIKKLTDEDFKIKPIPFDNPRLRLGARGIIFNENGEIAILYKEYKNEYKLIGGGIEENENPELAFKREAFEETGRIIKIDEYLGVIEELKSQDNFQQTSHVYVGRAVTDVGYLSYTKKEIQEGSKLLWLSYNKAMKLIKESEKNLLPSPCEGDMSVYHAKFIVRRDYEILKYYKELKTRVR